MRPRCAPILSALAALSCTWSLAGPVAAHTGGPLDGDGCHADRRRGNFHCHRGPARGYEFRSRAAMKEAVESGSLAERPADTEGFLQKLWPFGERDETGQTPPPPPVPVEAGAGIASPGPAAHSANEADAATTDVATPAAVPSAPAIAPLPKEAVPPTKTSAPSPSPTIVAPSPSTPSPVLPAAALSAPPAEASPVERSVRDYEERLRTLDGLRERGVITREEYQARRKAILDEI